MLRVLLLGDAIEVTDNHSQVITCVSRLLKEILDTHVEDFHRLECLAIDS